MFTRPAVDLVTFATRIGQRGRFATRRSRVRGLPEFGGEWPVAVLSEEIETPGPGQVRAAVTVAGNPVLSTPNGGRLARALGTLDFMVSIDFYLNETSRHAHLILPPVGPLERDHYDLVFHLLAVRDTAKYSPALYPPPADGRTDWQILLDLSRRIEAARGGQSLASRLTHAVLGRLGPRGVLDLLLRIGPCGPRPWKRGGLTLRRLERAPHGIDEPGECPPRYHDACLVLRFLATAYKLPRPEEGSRDRRPRRDRRGSRHLNRRIEWTGRRPRGGRVRRDLDDHETLSCRCHVGIFAHDAGAAAHEWRYSEAGAERRRQTLDAGLRRLAGLDPKGRVPKSPRGGR